MSSIIFIITTLVMSLGSFAVFAKNNTPITHPTCEILVGGLNTYRNNGGPVHRDVKQELKYKGYFPIDSEVFITTRGGRHGGRSTPYKPTQGMLALVEDSFRRHTKLRSIVKKITCPNCVYQTIPKENFISLLIINENGDHVSETSTRKFKANKMSLATAYQLRVKELPDCIID